jgi:hypothetical protein
VIGTLAVLDALVAVDIEIGLGGLQEEAIPLACGVLAAAAAAAAAAVAQRPAHHAALLTFGVEEKLWFHDVWTLVVFLQREQQDTRVCHERVRVIRGS